MTIRDGWYLGAADRMNTFECKNWRSYWWSTLSLSILRIDCDCESGRLVGLWALVKRMSFFKSWMKWIKWVRRESYVWFGIGTIGLGRYSFGCRWLPLGDLGCGYAPKNILLLLFFESWPMISWRVLRRAELQIVLFVTYGGDLEMVLRQIIWMHSNWVQLVGKRNGPQAGLA